VASIFASKIIGCIMEIIKDIKNAEKQAQDIRKEALEKSSRMLEDAKKQRSEALESRRTLRRKAIDQAVGSAEKEASMEASSLEMESNKIQQDILNISEQSLDTSANKVVEFIKSLRD
jgi:vacuolar-type H+-ATPase subunit H